MSGHTKGPWRDGVHHAVTQGGRTYAHICGSGIAPIAAVPLGVEGYGREEGEANARLIAAAPDLLEACKALVAAMRRYEVEVDGDAPQSHRDMMDHADAAITRADGGGS